MDADRDQVKDGDRGERPGEEAVRALYAAKPYPGLGVQPKNTGRWIAPIQHLLPRREIRYLDAGCGTGHSVVGMAKAWPQWRYAAVDISRPSLDVATELARQHGVAIDFRHGSYLDPLPFSGPFDLIASLGSVHHSQDPVRAIRNLLGYLAEDGIFMLWLFGREAHRGRLVVRDMLNLLEPDVTRHERRFALHQQLKRKQRPGIVDTLLDLSARKVLGAIRRAMESEYDRQQDWRYDFKAADHLWADSFSNPLERTYSVGDVQALAEASGLEVFLLTAQGREDLSLLPEGWRPEYARLDRWSQWKLMELLNIKHPRSFQIYGRRPGRAAARPGQ